MTYSKTGGRLAGRIALVTGASRGIGRAIALRYAAEGAHMVLVARTRGGLEEVDDAIRTAGGLPATLVPLDLREGAKIDEMGGALFQRLGRLDILVANAAVLGPISPLPHVDPKRWDEAIAVNLTANFRLIRSLDPLLRLSPSGRAIFVTSSAGRMHKAYRGVYGVTKAGLDMLVRTYSAETERTNIRVNLVDPGAVRTAMRAELLPGEDPLTVKTPETLGDLFVELGEASCQRHGEMLLAPNQA